MVNKADSQIEIKVILNGNKHASGSLNQIKTDGITHLNGEITKEDGKNAVIELVESN